MIFLICDRVVVKATTIILCTHSTTMCTSSMRMRIGPTFCPLLLARTNETNLELVYRKYFILNFRTIFCFLLLTHEGSHREVYREFQPSYDIFRRWCQGLIRPQVPCTPSLHCPFANSAQTSSKLISRCAHFRTLFNPKLIS